MENARFKLTRRKHSLGLMQVQTTEFIDDRKSVKLGLEKLMNAYSRVLKHYAWYTEWYIERKVISDYNKDDDYVHEVMILTDKIFELNNSQSKT